MRDTVLHIPTLETERLRLRAPCWSDFDAYAAFRTDAERTQFLGGPFSRMQAFDQLGEIAGHWLLRGYGRFVIADKITDKPLGIAGPYYPEGWPEPEIAWSVFKAAEGKGIAFEATFAARQFAYDTLGWTTAISLIANDNTRSIALAERLGAVPEGKMHHDDLGSAEIWRHPGPAEASA